MSLSDALADVEAMNKGLKEQIKNCHEENGKLKAILSVKDDQLKSYTRLVEFIKRAAKEEFEDVYY